MHGASPLTSAQILVVIPNHEAFLLPFDRLVRNAA